MSIQPKDTQITKNKIIAFICIISLIPFIWLLIWAYDNNLIFFLYSIKYSLFIN